MKDNGIEWADLEIDGVDLIKMFESYRDEEINALLKKNNPSLPDIALPYPSHRKAQTSKKEKYYMCFVSSKDNREIPGEIVRYLYKNDASNSPRKTGQFDWPHYIVFLSRKNYRELKKMATKYDYIDVNRKGV